MDTGFGFGRTPWNKKVYSLRTTGQVVWDNKVMTVKPQRSAKLGWPSWKGHWRGADFQKYNVWGRMFPPIAFHGTKIC